MPVIEFIGQSSKDADNPQNRTSRLVNCYREPTGGRSGRVLKSVLGTTGFATLPGVFLRAMIAANDLVYAAHGGRLVRISASSTVLDLTAIDDDENTFLSSNNGLITAAANGKYWVWDGATIDQPANLAFAEAQDVAFMGQRTVIIEKNGRKVQWSALADATDLDALDFATTEQRDDKNLRAFESGGLLWIFKETSIERWQDNGAGFSYIPGSLIDRGLKAASLAVKMPDGVFFIGDDGLPYIAQAGGISPPLSGGNRAVETDIKSSTPTHCIYHEDEGAKHCVIRFSDRPALVCNFSTGEWHERAEYNGDPWSAIASVQAFGSDLVGTASGGIYQLQRVNTDVVGPLVRSMTSNVLRIPDRPRGFRVPFLELWGQVGRSLLGRETLSVMEVDGLILEDGSGASIVVDEGDQEPRDAVVTLSASRDYGMTWTAPRSLSMGDQGEYSTAIRARSLGHFPDAMVLRLEVSDPAELSIDAECEVQII